MSASVPVRLWETLTKHFEKTLQFLKLHHPDTFIHLSRKNIDIR